MSEPFTPEYWKEMYECIGKTHVFWLISAKSLKASADIIWEKIEYTLYDIYGAKVSHNTEESEVESVYLMLLGMSIENALKALCIIHNAEIVSDGKLKATWGGDGHDLVQIASLAKFTRSEPDTQLLRNLSNYIRWAGRYPIPKHYSHDPVKDYPMIILPFEKERLNKLVDKIFTKVEDELSKRKLDT
jgi:hypothetical protein